MRVKKIVLALLFAITLLPAASLAQVAIRLGPPAPIYERPGPPPGRGFVWIGGYHNYVDGHYVWVPGYWGRPPYPGARWMAHRWVHRRGGYVLVQGHWR
jgi:hypothetical protein